MIFNFRFQKFNGYFWLAAPHTPWICDDVGGKGEAGRATGLQLETDEVVAALLHDEQHDWDADAVVRTLLS